MNLIQDGIFGVLTKEAVKHDLKNLAAVLDRQQMRTYIGILNTTFNNRGISIVE